METRNIFAKAIEDWAVVVNSRAEVPQEGREGVQLMIVGKSEKAADAFAAHLRERTKYVGRPVVFISDIVPSKSGGVLISVVFGKAPQ